MFDAKLCRGLLLGLVVPAWLVGQSYTASIRGVVTDASLAAVPGAKVTVTDVNRDTPTSTQTDSAGRYLITAPPPGTYTLLLRPRASTNTRAIHSSLWCSSRPR